MQKLVVSFIIPTYNSERTIANCIRSILRQNVEGVEKEIIVVDDRSTDRTVEISRSLGARVILKTLRSGVPESLNLGIQAARGEIIGLVDSDDYLTDGWLRTCLSKLKEVDGVHTTNIAYQPDKIFRKFAALALIKGFSIDFRRCLAGEKRAFR
jgi:glycosyltransferase involved in cell wall biosynthesis